MNRPNEPRAAEHPPPPRRKEISLRPVYQVVVECRDEQQQREVYERLTAEGRRCRLVLL